MKNIFLIIALIMLTVAANAQVSGDSVLRSKKGIPILPQAGDWAIGADAYPFLYYAGNMFNNNDDNELYLDDYILYGRYYLSDNTALRFKLGVNNSSSISRGYVRDDAAFTADPLSVAKTEDSYTYKYCENDLSIAYLKFRGYGRLRGFYGIEAGYSWNRSKYIYTYGNPMTVANPNPTMNWDGNNDGRRSLEQDNGIYRGLNLGAVAGVEFYFAPKMCIGYEISLTGSYNWKSQGNTSYEWFNGSSVVEMEEGDNPGGYTGASLRSSYGQSFYSSLYVMFHF